MKNAVLLQITDDDGNDLYEAIVDSQDTEFVKSKITAHLVKADRSYNVEATQMSLMPLDEILKDMVDRDVFGESLT